MTTMAVPATMTAMRAHHRGGPHGFQAVIGPGVEKILAFNIYDRWGNMVFDKTNYVPDPAGTDGWDGTFRNQKLDPGVIVYPAKALFIDGKVIDYTGSITLLDKLRN